MPLHFLGANRQVTGSRYLLEVAGLRILVDCGLFQERPFLTRNWEDPPFDPRSIDFLILTHAHLDHVGLVPRLVAQGFRGPIVTIDATIDLAKIVLTDSAEIQEEDAEFKRRRHAKEGRKGRFEPAPLYTLDQANKALKQFRSIAFNEPLSLSPEVTVRWIKAGHILGAGSLQFTIADKTNPGGEPRRIVFSGDLGLWNKPLIPDPELIPQADYLVMESTYGDKDHDVQGSVEDNIARIVNETVAAGGNLLIPTFAIERAQDLLFYFSKLTRAKKIPMLSVFLDSPMAIDATQIFVDHPDCCLDAETVEMLRTGNSPFKFPGLRFLRTGEESKSINHIRGSCVIMAGAGMCTAGRIKHHLAHHLANPATTVLFVGYQAQGTLGREILERRPTVRILGFYTPVRARIEQISGLSAHADRSTLLRWLGGFQQPPKKLFLTHGEEAVSLALAQTIREKLKWDVEVPEYQSVAPVE
ncbi:MAG: MBL fold metallo-hydrolase [Planctomycetota bacterium]|nr:MBL fold metallo-hydrolase [Planctomycetota bacterium]